MSKQVIIAAARQWWLWRNRRAFCEPRSEQLPRLLVDLSTISRFDAATGIQRVVRAVWAELTQRNGQGFLLYPVIATQKHGYCHASLRTFSGCKLPPVGRPVAAQPGDIFLGLDLAAQILPHYRNQLKAWRRCGTRIHVVVYDLLPLRHPEWFSRAGVRNFRRWFASVADLADGAICISPNTAQDLAARLKERGADHQAIVGTIQLGGDIENSLPSGGTDPVVGKLVEQMRSRSTLLMVGTMEPRKGYDAALAAFEHLWGAAGEQAPDLVIIGKPGWKTGNLQRQVRAHPQHGQRLHWLTHVSDEELALLYDASCGLLMASRGEGMGLPLIEAAMNGCAILARDLPVFREQKLPRVRFFRDDSPKALADDIRRLVRDPPASNSQNSKLPTWSAAVDQLLANLGLPVKRSDERREAIPRAPTP